MPPTFNNQNIKITLPNQVGYERIAMACAATFAKMVGLSPERIEDLKTIVAEASINAMQHGNKERPDAKVIVLMNFTDDTIFVSVQDEGEGFEEFLPDPDIERIVNSLKKEEAVIVFPAGEVSRAGMTGIKDGKWNRSEN